METKANQAVLIVFQDTNTRNTAVEFCDLLVSRFWAQSGFDVNWCSFDSLQDPKQMSKSAMQAAHADIVVFSMEPDGVLPHAIKKWAETWVQAREDREGAIIGLCDPARSGDGHANKYTWLRGVARRAGMDYLVEAPQQIKALFGSPDVFKDRARQKTSVLDDILRHHPIPHFRPLPQ